MSARRINAPYCPLPSRRVLTNALRAGRYRLGTLGLERYCRRCDEFWPADTEFFNACRTEPTGLNAWCKACNSEAKRAARQAAQGAANRGAPVWRPCA